MLSLLRVQRPDVSLQHVSHGALSRFNYPIRPIFDHSTKEAEVAIRPLLDLLRCLGLARSRLFKSWIKRVTYREGSNLFTRREGELAGKSEIDLALHRALYRTR
jgi:hypothetical protein